MRAKVWKSCPNCRRMQAKLDAQEARLKALEATVARLQERLAAARKDSSTSSKPVPCCCCCEKGTSLISMPGEDCWPRKIPSVSDVPLNETAPRWENTNYSPSLRRTCFTLASRHQSLAQTAPLRRAINLRIKANPVPPPGFVQEACTRKAATACGEAIVCVRRPFGYRLLPFPGGPA